jgi:hypothetical protein
LDSRQPKKIRGVHLWMFLQGFPRVKEIAEPEFAGFSTSCTRVSSVHQGDRRAAASYEIWIEE